MMVSLEKSLSAGWILWGRGLRASLADGALINEVDLAILLARPSGSTLSDSESAS